MLENLLFFKKHAIRNLLEASHSGLVRPLGERVCLNRHREFKSRPFRQDFEMIVEKISKKKKFRLSRYPSDENAQPILVPRKNIPWEAKAVFNPSVILDGNVFRMLYRTYLVMEIYFIFI